MSHVQFIHAKKRTRGELRLPQLHFIVCDDWIDKIGERAFAAWLKFYSWADRSDPERDYEKIPGSLNKVAEKLGVSKPTFYNTIIGPLWEYGFIDLEEYEHNKTRCMNIIVYEYPQNDPARATLPLEKIRDYRKDYTSVSREKGKNGGLKTAMLRKKEADDGVVKNFYQDEGGKKIEPPLVKNFYQGGKNNLPNNDPNRSNRSNNTNGVKIDQSLIESDSLNSTSPVILDIINTDDRLKDRYEHIIKLYSISKTLPGFSDYIFIYTLQKTINAKIDTNFENYFMAALMNNLRRFTEKDGQNRAVKSLPKSVRDAMAETAASSEYNNPSLTKKELLKKQLKSIELLYKIGDIPYEEYLAEKHRLMTSFSHFDEDDEDNTTAAS